MSFFTPNTDFYNDFYDKARYVMAWRISLGFSCVFLILSAVFSFSDPTVLTLFLIVSGISIGSLIYLKTVQKYKLLFWIYAISGTILVHIANNTVYDFTHYVDIIWMLAIILLAFVSLGRKVGIIFILIHAVGISYFFIFTLNHHIEVLQPRTFMQLIGDIIEVSFALLVVTYLLSQYVVFNNYFANELKKANAELSKKNEENITLVKEIHHRVKNNLQIIISLLRLQRGELKSDEAKNHFNEAINRIMVMSLIHKKLYQEKELANINIVSYLTDLSDDIKTISNLGLPISINVSSEIEQVDLKTIVPLGLLANELISNSIKHAFFRKESGEINIIIKKIDSSTFKLIYNDDGTWVEPNKNNPSFGLELISILTAQLEGNCSRIDSEFNFTLKNLDI